MLKSVIKKEKGGEGGRRRKKKGKEGLFTLPPGLSVMDHLVLDNFIASWHNQVYQVHLCIFGHRPEISCYSLQVLFYFQC